MFDGKEIAMTNIAPHQQPLKGHDDHRIGRQHTGPGPARKITKLALLATAMSAATIALAATAHACGGSGGTAYKAHTFQSPSGNIACDYQVGFGGDDNKEVVQCEVRDHAWVAPAATCTGAYNDEQRASNAAGGDEVSLIGGKPSLLGCYWGFGGPLSTPNGKTTLEYGQTLSVGAITCDSEPSGVTCTDSSTGHFFRVSRESYELG